MCTDGSARQMGKHPNAENPLVRNAAWLCVFLSTNGDPLPVALVVTNAGVLGPCGSNPHGALKPIQT